MEELIIYLQTYAIFNIAVICWGIGYILKHFIAKLPNKYIPLILACCGLFLNIAFNQWQFTPEIILTGLGSGLVATGSFEAIRNLYEKKPEVKAPDAGTGGNNE